MKLIVNPRHQPEEVSAQDPLYNYTDIARKILTELPNVSKQKDGGIEELRNLICSNSKIALDENSFYVPSLKEEEWMRRIEDEKVILGTFVEGFFIEVSRSRQNGAEYCYTATVFANQNESSMAEINSVGGAALASVFDRLEDVAFRNMAEDSLILERLKTA